MKISGVTDSGNGLSFEGADISGNHIVTVGMPHTSGNPDTEMVRLQDGLLSMGKAQGMTAQQQSDYAELSLTGRQSADDMSLAEDAGIMNSSRPLLNSLKSDISHSGSNPTSSIAKAADAGSNPTKGVQQAASDGKDVTNLSYAFRAPLEVMQAAPTCCVDDNQGVNVKA